MDFPEPLLPSTLPHTHTHPTPDTASILPLTHTPSRGRRTSLSGKLLNLFAPNPKARPKPPPRPRPVISRPQPLESLIPARQKRASHQAANDENDPVSPSLSPRPRSRLRLASSTSVDHDSREKLQSPPRPERALRPLKGVLKKSASENQSHTVPLDSTPPSHPRASSEPQQTHATSVLATSTVTSKLRIKEPKFAKRLRTASWMPFPTQHSRAPLEVTAASASSTLKAKPHVQTRKHVAFAMDSPRLGRTPSMHHIPSATSSSSDQDHWSDIAMELDSPSHSASSGATVSPPRKRKAEDIADPRYGPQSPPGSPVMSRKVKKSPAVPTRTRMGEIVDEALKDFARERSAVFRPVVTKLGPPGVLQRMSADIVPHERHSTIWDADENDIYAWGGTLLLRDSKPASYFYPRHCIQDLRIELFMHDEPTSSPPVPSIEMSDEDVDEEDLRPRYSWSTVYKAHRVPRDEILTRLSSGRGIAVEPEYVFVGPPTSNPNGPCAWLVHFWAPVPLRLLIGREVCKSLVCRAWVSVGDWDTPRTVVPAGCCAATIECLRSEKMLGKDARPR